MATTPINPIDQTFAIIFSNVPSHFTWKDIILNHFNASNRCSISDKASNRWRRILRIIEFTPHNKCIIIFSSIFYFCKYARLVSRQNNKGIKVSIHPKYYKSIRRVSNIDFAASNTNNKLIKLHNINTVIAYTFIHNKSIYMTTKFHVSLQEILIKIPIINISKININTNHNNIDQNKLKQESKYPTTEIAISLNKNCKVYEYYHKHKLWKCKQCGNIN
eukprot:442121_1